MHVKNKQTKKPLSPSDLHAKCAYLLLGRMNLGFNYFYTNYVLLIYGLVIY